MKKVNNCILLRKYFGLTCIYFFIRSESISYGDVTMCPSHVTMYPSYGACCHISLPLFQGKSRKKVYTVLIKQNHIIVLNM